MRKFLLLLACLCACAFNLPAQQIINGNQSFVPGAWVGTQVPNASVTGTTANSIALINSSGQAVISATTNTTGMAGIVVSGAGTSGNATIAQTGQTVCNFDSNGATAGDFVINSTSVAGDCADGGATIPSVQVFGYVISGGAGAGQYSVMLAVGSGNTGCTTTIGALQYNGGSSLNCAQGITTPDGNNLNIKGPIPWIDGTKYGMRTFINVPNTITVTTNGTTSITTTGVSDFIKNDGIVVPAAGATTSQSTPSAPTVSAIGATGSTTYDYKCVGVDSKWGLTAASTAGSTATGPQVFGWAAVGISSISRSSNVVTVTTSSSMAVSSGTFHAVIGNVTGGSTQFSGLQLVTVTSATTLTYNQTGANESGTAVATSYVLFKNAFIITSVQATAGSNQLVLTTDVNHNIQFSNSGTRPTKIFLDGIQFSGATPQGYADGLFGVAGVTSNTITVTTPYTSPITVAGTASASFATSAVAQMTATVYPVIDVACPAVSGATQFYAVYGSYNGGSSYAPIGFTAWGANIFEDYGPAFTETGFVSPPAMSLPATPPSAAQSQVYEGQITGIAGSTLTVTPTVPGSVSTVTGYHSNGSAFTNALTASCTGSGLSSVYLPQPSGSTVSYYFFNAPFDISASGCTRASIVDGGPVWANGTIFASNTGMVEWRRPQDVTGWTTISSGFNNGGQAYIIGYAPTEMFIESNFSGVLRGLQFNTLSNGQIGLEITGSNVSVSDSSFLAANNINLSSMPLYLYNTQFGIQFHNLNWNCDPNVMYPINMAASNSVLGEVTYWTVPCIEITGTFLPKVTIDGINYGSYRGIQNDNLYNNSHTLPYYQISHVDTFQAPWTPLLTFYGAGGGGPADNIILNDAVMDSVQQPMIGCVSTALIARCSNTFSGQSLITDNANTPILTGAPFDAVQEVPSSSLSPAQNTNEFSLSPTGIQLSGPSSGATPALGLDCEGGTNALNVINPAGTVTASLACPDGHYSMLETSAPSGVASTDILYADSATHRWNLINNNGSASPAATLADFAAPPAIGNTTPAAGSFTTLSASSNLTTNVTGGGAQCLHVNNSGVVAGTGADCGSGGGGANAQLSNLSAVAINSSLIPGAVNTVAAGSNALPFTNLFLGTVANQAGSFNTGNLTANRTINLPDATSTPVRDCPAVTNKFMTAEAVATGNCTQSFISASAATPPSYVADSGAVNAYVATLSPAIAAYSAGLVVRFLPANANTTTNPTLNVNAVGAATITKFGTAALVASDLITTQIAVVIYDGTNWELQNPATVANVVTASSTNTFTNKTINAESTGNSISIPVKAFFPAAGCNNSTAANAMDLGPTNAATPQCGGSTVTKGYLQFVRGNVAYINFHLPPDWNSSASTDIELGMTSTDTTNGHVISFNVQTGCSSVTGAATDDPSLNGAQAASFTIGASQVSGGAFTFKLTGMTMTGCSADNFFEIVLTRNNSGTDTATNALSAASLKFAELTIGVTKNAANR